MKEQVKKASIKDIAKQSGVAISTVSHVINNTKFVAEGTREKVTKVINELHYRPNLIARGLRTKSTRTIGLLLPDIRVNKVLPGASYGIFSNSYCRIINLFSGFTYLLFNKDIF